MIPPANVDKLVHPAWLFDQLSGVNPGFTTRESFLVFEIGASEQDKYRRGHIPGAIYLDTNALERAPSWNVLPAAELEGALLTHGITAEKTVLLYGRDRQAVARTALILLYAGVGDVRLLDGGIEAWGALGYPLEFGNQDPAPARSFGQQLPAHPEYIIGMEQARALLADPNAAVVCVRTWEEYIGATSGYDYIQPKGRLPGSVWAGPLDIHPLPGEPGEHRAHIDRLCHEIADHWRERGITPEKRIAFYCGTGWRASEAFFYAHLMGWQNICIYDGGWLEWSAQPDNPIEVGEPR